MRSSGISRTEERRDTGLMAALRASNRPGAAVGADGTITEASAGLQALSGYPGPALRGMPVGRLLDRLPQESCAIEARMFSRDSRAMPVRATALKGAASAIIIIEALPNEHEPSPRAR